MLYNQNIKQGTLTIGNKTYRYKSAWEANVACYFEYLKSKEEIRDWEYEPITFWFEKIKRGTRSYKPDFKIIRPDCSIYYVEVKGWMDSKSKTKLNRMRIYYPDIEMVLIDSKKYAEISKNYRNLVPNWGILEKTLRENKKEVLT